jgi:hypothetical protein
VWSAVLPLLYCLFSAIIGTQSVLFSKTLAVLLRATASGDNQVCILSQPYDMVRFYSLLLHCTCPCSVLHCIVQQVTKHLTVLCGCCVYLRLQLSKWFTWLVLPAFLFTAVFWVSRLNKVRLYAQSMCHSMSKVNATSSSSSS